VVAVVTEKRETEQMAESASPRKPKLRTPTRSAAVRTFDLAIDRITAPLYRPIRRILPDFGGIDFSPLVILILIQVLKKLLAGVVIQYYGV
jgi:uncharacterized protein YggT (Ycf19 family)